MDEDGVGLFSFFVLGLSLCKRIDYFGVLW